MDSEQLSLLSLTPNKYADESLAKLEDVMFACKDEKTTEALKELIPQINSVLEFSYELNIEHWRARYDAKDLVQSIQKEIRRDLTVTRIRLAKIKTILETHRYSK